MGTALAAHLDAGAEIDIWASPAGRTLQTVAIIAEGAVSPLRTSLHLAELGS